MIRSCFLCTFFFVAISFVVANPINDSVFSKQLVTTFLKDQKAKQESSLKLFIFLSPECPLCQQSTITLNKLYGLYGNEIDFYAIIPGRAYGKSVIKNFKTQFDFKIPTFIDYDKKLTNSLLATVTPEVILINNKYELVYKGAIDDIMVSLGKRRLTATAFYLSDAIMKSLENSVVLLKRTKAVGCTINDF
jgi:thiol-disulfide isomerase/thioredoxin